MIYTTAKVSAVGTVNNEDLKKWVRNLGIFLIPLGLLYLAQLQGGFQDGILLPKEFLPTPTTIGGMELYIINGLTDLLNKFRDGSK